MKAYVAVTDMDWYAYLSSRPAIHEANFWRPYGSRSFKVLVPGEPFIFKTKAPQNKVVGGAIYEGFVSLNISRAWEFFGEGNGVSSPEALVERLRSITGETAAEIGDREIGCALLRNICFLPHQEQLPAPVTFSKNIVQGKSYTYPGEDSIIDFMVQRVLAQETWSSEANQDSDNFGPTHGDPRMIIPRLGQGGLQSTRAGGLLPAMRCHAAPNCPDTPSGAHSPHISWRSASRRQRNPPTFRCAHDVRPRLCRN